jgi:hypothetical protein
MQYIKKPGTHKEVVEVSVRGMRLAIGILGFILPFLLIIGAKLIGGCTDIESSISHYYYTIVGDVFVGAICAISFYLILYRGPERPDNIASTIAGCFALPVALLPTTEKTVCNVVLGIHPPDWLSKLHFASAALFFCTLAYMSWALFTRSKGFKTKEKSRRNFIYRLVAVVIIASIGLIAYFVFVKHSQPPFLGMLKPVFALEWTALAAFAISWLVKAEVLPFLRDSEESQQAKLMVDRSHGGLELSPEAVEKFRLASEQVQREVLNLLKVEKM